MKKLIIAFSCFSLFSCANSKKATQEKSAPQEVVVEKKYRFTVSFISVGSGIDVSARKAYDQYINDFEQKNKTRLTVDKVNWGKEGETDYCFDLNNLNQAQQAKFIAETKTKLNTSKLVRYERNTTCREGRK